MNFEKSLWGASIRELVDEAFNKIELKICMTLKEAVEKQEPLCVHDVEDGIRCPVCNNFVATEKNHGRKNYCSNCGQELKWEA